MNTADTGRTGERIAVRYLKRNGYRILARNFRAHRHEIDVIACERGTGTTVFAEVKTRSPNSYGRPMEAVGADKRRFLRLAAESWLLRHGGVEQPARFDVIEVMLPEKTVNHLINAF
ncbi:MAG: YraN family protein [Clostridia bacterium]|nr:YraN family protein [Clostridia bacterium]